MLVKVNKYKLVTVRKTMESVCSEERRAVVPGNCPVHVLVLPGGWQYALLERNEPRGQLLFP